VSRRENIAQVADWLENYAHVLELDVWISAKVTQAKWNDKTKSWHAEIVRQGKDTRHFDVKHLVFATGFGGGIPVIPDIPEKVHFSLFREFFF
jgi:cation diffusion facilitator CzcD-associated flavoprotein CzcO